MKRRILLYLFLITGFAYSQSPKQFLKNIRSNYEDLKSLELTMEYNLYKGHKAKEIVQSYNAVYRRKGDESYRKINQTEFISTARYNIKLNHQEKIMIVTDPIPLEAFDVDVKASLKFCQNVLVNNHDDEYILTLLIKEKTDLPYGKIDIVVDKNYWVKEMTFYYSTLMDFSPSYSTKEMDYPKMVVKYQLLKKKWKNKEKMFDVEKYISEEKGELLPAESFSEYKILNLTNTH